MKLKKPNIIPVFTIDCHILVRGNRYYLISSNDQRVRIISEETLKRNRHNPSHRLVAPSLNNVLNALELLIHIDALNDITIRYLGREWNVIDFLIEFKSERTEGIDPFEGDPYEMPTEGEEE